MNKNTSTYYYHQLRLLIYDRTDDQSPFQGEVEVDESYFGGRRKGRRGGGAVRKVPVFGLLKRDSKVYTNIIVDAKATTLMLIIRENSEAR